MVGEVCYCTITLENKKKLILLFLTLFDIFGKVMTKLNFSCDLFCPFGLDQIKVPVAFDATTHAQRSDTKSFKF